MQCKYSYEKYQKIYDFHSFNIAAIGVSLRRALRADCPLKKEYSRVSGLDWWDWVDESNQTDEMDFVRLMERDW